MIGLKTLPEHTTMEAAEPDTETMESNFMIASTEKGNFSECV